MKESWTLTAGGIDRRGDGCRGHRGTGKRRAPAEPGAMERRGGLEAGRFVWMLGLKISVFLAQLGASGKSVVIDKYARHLGRAVAETQILANAVRALRRAARYLIGLSRVRQTNIYVVDEERQSRSPAST